MPMWPDSKMLMCVSQHGRIKNEIYLFSYEIVKLGAVIQLNNKFGFI